MPVGTTSTRAGPTGACTPPTWRTVVARCYFRSRTACSGCAGTTRAQWVKGCGRPPWAATCAGGLQTSTTTTICTTITRGRIARAWGIMPGAARAPAPGASGYGGGWKPNSRHHKAAAGGEMKGNPVGWRGRRCMRTATTTRAPLARGSPPRGLVRRDTDRRRVRAQARATTGTRQRCRRRCTPPPPSPSPVRRPSPSTPSSTTAAGYWPKTPRE
mmetsp:Transcript_17461/g.43250  ORF Transcript_17461/g.43250 Transcript_17461/m.43250 type:complete len:215 (+) Transcript_17461:671-1315(+)